MSTSFSFSFFPKSLWFCFVDIWLLRNFKKKKRKENGIFALACGWINIFNILVCFSNYLSNSNLSDIFPWNSCVWGDYILYLVVEKRRRFIALHYGSIMLLYNIYSSRIMYKQMSLLSINFYFFLGRSIKSLGSLLALWVLLQSIISLFNYHLFGSQENLENESRVPTFFTTIWHCRN